MLFKTYLGLINEIKLNIKYKQLPTFCLNKEFNRNINFELRKKMKLNFHPNNLFEEFIFQDFFFNIPLEFLENFTKIGKYIDTYKLPNNPQIICSTRSLSTDNIFVRYVAEKKENGSKFIYAQHGGAYGQIKFSWRRS